jgi:cytochrome c biogenesis protein CcmG/thiol:disulfide interchange protein DsbE
VTVRLKRVGQGVAVGLVVGLLALLVWKVAQGSGKTKEPANFNLKRLDRPGKLELTASRGKVVVLNFWGSWCIPCGREAPVLERAWERYRKRGVVFVGIDQYDFSSDARKFMRKYHITYPVVQDGLGTLVGPYGVTGWPETRFVDRNGHFIGDRVIGPITREELERNIELALRS